MRVCLCSQMLVPGKMGKAALEALMAEEELEAPAAEVTAREAAGWKAVVLATLTVAPRPSGAAPSEG